MVSSFIKLIKQWVYLNANLVSLVITIKVITIMDVKLINMVIKCLIMFINHTMFVKEP
jgi:hypothetical protein